MVIGLIGAGSMAAAMARGFGEPALVADPDRERASRLAEEVGGEAFGSNAEVARRADLVVLCHKPAQLAEVADEVGAPPRAIASILWGVTVAELERAYPDVPVYRFMPNIPVEERQGLLVYVPGALADEGPEERVLELFGRLGTIVRLDESLVDAAGAVMSCGPAFFSLVVEALADAASRRGLPDREARRLATETMAGAAAVLRASDYDTAALHRRVASPGGVTERGVEMLERGRVRQAFEDAVDVVTADVDR